MNSIFKDFLSASLNFPRDVYALWRIYRLKGSIVTVFGGKQAEKESYFYKRAFEIGKLLAQKNYSVLTGGGPGIMEAALCGALHITEDKSKVLGIGVVGIDTEFKTECDQDTVFVSSFP